MQLLAAHQILIASALALASLFGLRALVLFARGGGAVNLVMAAASVAVAVALGVYFRQIRARWREARQAGAPQPPPRR
jgi:hypothetical protein